MTITLPYPPKELNPNNRSCWQKKFRKAKTYKNDCWISLLAHRGKLKGKTKFRLTFCAPDTQHRDVDNAVAAFKYGQDMLAKAVGLDDSKFEIIPVMGEPKPPYGAVNIEVVE